MRILLLCEPRSGSTNFANWFLLQKDFTVLFLPTDPESKWYRVEFPYKYNTKHLLIKEDFYVKKNYDNLISIADKIILLHRENELEQIESWLQAKYTNNWHTQYVFKKEYDKNEETFFKELKKAFKENYLNKYFTISYEELYFSNGLNKVIDYLNIKELQKDLWPVGTKYRLLEKEKTLL